MAKQFVGFVSLGSTLVGTIVTRNTSDTPLDAAALPTFRVYGPTPALMTNGTGTTAKLNTGTITGATNAAPIVITSTAHGLNTGTRVVVANVGGNTAANASFTITNVSANTFSLDGSTGNGAYTSGGDWHVDGLYSFSVAATAANGYAAGSAYSILFSYTVSGTAMADHVTFIVV